jgi:AcrR family transcriptional regulator
MGIEETPRTAQLAMGARQRILDTAYELFSHNGLRAVGIERIIDESAVAKKTLYRHFPSKVDLILAFLEMRGQRWTRDWLLAEIQQLAATPRGQLLAVFDAFDEWFHRADYESCALICTLLEVRDKANPVHQQASRQLELVRKILQELAQQADLGDPEQVSRQIHILMMGAIVAATRGDLRCRSARARGRRAAPRERTVRLLRGRSPAADRRRIRLPRLRPSQLLVPKTQ